MKKNTNDLQKSTLLKKKTQKKNAVFDIIKIKNSKNRKNSQEVENIIYSYNIQDKKNTNLKKIFNYHEIFDLYQENLLHEKNTNTKISEINYSAKLIFLDRHVKSFTNGETSNNTTLDSIEKEEKSKIIDMFLIKSEIISENYHNKNNLVDSIEKKNFINNNINISTQNNLNHGYNQQEDDLSNIITNYPNLQAEKNKTKNRFLKEIFNYISKTSILPNNQTKTISTNNPNKSVNNSILLSNNNNIQNNSVLSTSSNNIIKISTIPSNTNLPNTNPNDLIFKDFFRIFTNYFPEDFDSFEYQVIKALSDKMNFTDFSNIFLFLYDDLKKLRDQKTIDLLKNKLKEHINDDLSILKTELKNYYEFRSNIINDYLTRQYDVNEWTEEKVFNEIILTSLIAEKLKNTTELDLTQNYIMGKNIQMIMSALKFNKFIWKINLNSNKIGDEGMFLLGRVLHYNNKITDLDISLNFLVDKSLGLLIKGIDNTFVNLQRLNLSNNNGLSSQAGEKFKQIIRLSPNLKTLNISRINLEMGIVKVLEGLIENKNVEELICISTQLTDDVLYEISKFFSENSDIRLKRLNLSDNKFPGNSSKEFFNSLCYNKYLKELILYNCKLENHIIENFCRMLKINSSLEKIILYNNELNNFENLKKILKVKKYQLNMNKNSGIIEELKEETKNLDKDKDESKNNINRQNYEKEEKKRNILSIRNNYKINIPMNNNKNLENNNITIDNDRRNNNGANQISMLGETKEILSSTNNIILNSKESKNFFLIFF